MYIRHLSVADFRSWPTAELPLAPGATVLVGHNGAGKTNLVEAIGFLATLSSHRVAADAALIRRGTEQAMVRAAVVSGGRELLLEAEINAGRANRVRINRVDQRRPRDLLGVLRTVTFAPEDLVLVRGDPSDRRRFLDEQATMLAPRLAGVRADYDRVVRQRSTLLKSAGAVRGGGRAGGGSAGTSALATLDAWDDQLARAGAELIVARLELVAALRPHLVSAYADLAAHSHDDVDLAYASTLGDALDPGERDPAAVAALMLSALAARRGEELARGVCLVGPHRDDVTLLLADAPAKHFASHGESWTFALAAKLAALAVQRESGVRPVLILDDVFAELDPSRRDRLLARLPDAEQVIVTAAAHTDVPAELKDRIVEVGHGRVGGQDAGGGGEV